MLGERPVFKMYVKDGCPYCDKARDFILREMQMSLHTINITQDPHMREMIIEDTGQKTLPAIFLGGVFLGGCDDLHAHDTPGSILHRSDDRPTDSEDRQRTTGSGSWRLQPKG